MIVVADSGPLISLARIGHLGLLWRLHERVIIPAPVYHEVVVAGAGRDGSAEVMRLVFPGDIAAVGHGYAALRKEMPELGSGEAAAIACALDLRVGLVLMDDLAGRRAAEARGLRIHGTLGILVAAKSSGLIAEIRPLIATLLARGAWMDRKVVAEALRMAGETT